MTISAPRKITALVIPWLFLAVYATMYWALVLPRVSGGSIVALCIGAFIAVVFVVFLAAAVTFSRDVLQNRWP